jgi:hypothetical protein
MCEIFWAERAAITPLGQLLDAAFSIHAVAPLPLLQLCTAMVGTFASAKTALQEVCSNGHSGRAANTLAVALPASQEGQLWRRRSSSSGQCEVELLLPYRVPDSGVMLQKGSVGQFVKLTAPAASDTAATATAGDREGLQQGQVLVSVAMNYNILDAVLLRLQRAASAAQAASYSSSGSSSDTASSAAALELLTEAATALQMLDSIASYYPPALRAIEAHVQLWDCVHVLNKAGLGHCMRAVVGEGRLTVQDLRKVTISYCIVVQSRTLIRALVHGAVITSVQSRCNMYIAVVMSLTQRGTGTGVLRCCAAISGACRWLASSSSCADVVIFACSMILNRLMSIDWKS